MKKNFKMSLIAAACMSAIVLSCPSFAKTTALSELNDLPSSSAQMQSNAITQKNWVYKTLEDLTKKHGTVTSSEKKLLGESKPITRNEAAILLINLLGKIEQDKIQLSEEEKTDLKYVKKELKEEISALQSKIASLDTSVESLQGSVSKLEESNSKAVKFGFGKDMKLSGGMVGGYTGMLKRSSDGSASNFNLSFIDVAMSGKLNEHMDYFVEMLPNLNTDNKGSIMGDYWVGTDILKDHYIKIGRTWVPIGSEGAASPYALTFANRSQLSRNLSAHRDLGIKVSSNRKYVDYYAGVFNGSRGDDTDNNSAMDMMGWVDFKPLAAKPQLGSLMIGGGYANGKNNYSYNTYGSHIGYKYKKFGIDGEYAFADGYGASGTHSNGYFVTSTYDLTKKIQLAGRYDSFDSNTRTKDTTNKEYTAGINYFIKDSNIKFQLNYVYVDLPGTDAQKIQFLSQIHTY